MTHTFLKLKTPICNHVTSKPLLVVNLYEPHQELLVEWAAKEKRRSSPDKIKRHHHHQRCEHRHQRSSDPMTGGYVTRSKEQLREEMKQKKRLERKRDDGMPKLVTKLEGLSVSEKKGEGPGKEAAPTPRGHGK